MLDYKILFKNIEKKHILRKWKHTINYSRECEILFLMGNVWFRFWTWGNINSFVSTAVTKNKKLYILSFFHQKSPLFWLKLTRIVGYLQSVNRSIWEISANIKKPTKLVYDSNCSCLMCIKKTDFLLKLFNHETKMPLQPFLLKLYLVNYKLKD